MQPNDVLEEVMISDNLEEHFGIRVR